MGVYSETNTTLIPLSAGEQFVGGWQDTHNVEAISVSVGTDVAGELTIQFSMDQSSIDLTQNRWVRPANPPHPYRFSVCHRYFRCIFTNTSPVDQTSLRIQTTMHTHIQNIVLACNQQISADCVGTIVRPTDFKYEVALSQRHHYVSAAMFGYNPDIDMNVEETVWSYGGLYVPLSGPSTLSIVSSSALDTAAGTGARTISLTGVDAAFNQQIETVVLNGTTPVVTTTVWRGVNCTKVITAGTGATNAGTVTVSGSGGGPVISSIPLGAAACKQVVYYTRDEHRLLLDYITLNMMRTNGSDPARVTLKLYAKNLVTGVRTEVVTWRADVLRTHFLPIALSHPMVFGGKMLLELRALSDSNDVFVGAFMEFLEVADPDAMSP